MAQQYARDEAGHIWEVDEQGNPLRLVQPAPASQGQVFTLPQDPAEAQRMQLAQRADARQAAADARAQSDEQRKRLEWNAAHNPDGSIKPTALKGSTELTAATRANAINAFTATRQLDQLITDIETKFRTGPGATKGVYGLTDYLPTPANRRFDAAGDAVRGAAITALGFTSGQTNTPREVEQNIGPYIPKAGDYDAVIQDKIARLKELRDRARVQAVTVLGGVPSADGRITPVSQLPRDEYDQLFPPGTMQPSTMAPPAGGASPPNPPAAAGSGAIEGSTQVPPEMQAAHERYLAAHWGNLDPQDYAAFRVALDRQYGFSSTPDQYAQSVKPLNDLAMQGRSPAQATIPAVRRELSGFDQARNNFVSSGLGAGITSSLNAMTFGVPGMLAPGQTAAMEALQPTATTIGNVVGGIPAAAAMEVGLGAAAARMAPGIAARALGSPIVADALYGATTSATGGGDPLTGALAGVGGGVAGRTVMRPVSAAVRGADRVRRGIFGLPPLPAQLPPAQRAVLDAANRTGEATVDQYLSNAASLGIPASLADAGPQLRSLAGAAVRRSPSAAEVAERALLPRARGQIDRFSQAVETNLGPTANIPQLSADLSQQAQAAAGPLYRQAYATPVPSTPELESLLATPFGRQAIGRARTIIANERRNPTELGFALDEAGNPVLNPQPSREMAAHLFARQELDEAQNAYRAARSGQGDVAAARTRVEAARKGLRDAEAALAGAPDPTVAASVPNYTTQALDYAKRGMDDVLEQYRNPITNRLVLDEAGKAQNDVKNSLLSEIDRLNDPYRQARATYAGPVQSRDALARGQDALTLNPDLLAMQVANQTPEHLGQMQLGYRSALMDRANQVRFSGNPYDATLGTPAAEARLRALYPNSSGVDQLLRARDLEGQLARTNNAILGNSATAERQIADQAFAGSDLTAMALDAGALALGGVPTATVGRKLSGHLLGDALKLGIGKRATRKAEEIAPILLNPDPAASATALRGIRDAAQSYDDLIRGYNRTIGRSGGIFGAALLPSLVPLNQ